MTEMAVMNTTGDSKTVWDPKIEDEVEAAENTFDELTEKGYSAFDVKAGGRKGRRMDKFDPEAGKIIMVAPIKGG